MLMLQNLLLESFDSEKRDEYVDAIKNEPTHNRCSLYISFLKGNVNTRKTHTLFDIFHLLGSDLNLYGAEITQILTKYSSISGRMELGILMAMHCKYSPVIMQLMTRYEGHTWGSIEPIKFLHYMSGDTVDLRILRALRVTLGPKQYYTIYERIKIKATEIIEHYTRKPAIIPKFVYPNDVLIITL